MVRKHFNGQDLYREQVERNITYARTLANESDMSSLRRQPPRAVAGEEEEKPQPR